MAEDEPSLQSMIALLPIDDSRKAGRYVENHASLSCLWASSGDKSLLPIFFPPHNFKPQVITHRAFFFFFQEMSDDGKLLCVTY